MNRISTLLFFVLASSLFANPIPSQPDLELFRSRVRPFLEQSCIRCHGPEKQKASFRLDNLSPVIDSSPLAQQWREVLDMLSVDEMPPEDEPRPASTAVTTVTDWISKEL